MNIFFRLLIITALSQSYFVDADERDSDKALTSQLEHKLTCEFDDVVFSANFETGRLSFCKELGPNHYLLGTSPENTPINPSPWYAFSVKAKQKDKQSILIEIQAEGSRARYMPKLSANKKDWEALDFEIKKDNLLVSLDVGEATGIQYISAQEIIDKQMHEAWNRNLAQNSSFELRTLGKSKLGRNIEALIHEQADNTEWLMIIGRQHPPEVTGALAMFSFMEALSEETQLNTALFDRFNIFFVPLVNPDGVVTGNWRHNANGIDLNRDWGKFGEPETNIVHKKLRDLLGNEHNLAFALDFHSTQQDIFYTMPTDYIPIVHENQNIELGVLPKSLVSDWLESLKQSRLRSFTVRERPGSSRGRGVFKQFIADEYGVHAVTFEIGDNTNRTLIKHIGRTSAHSLAKTLLSVPPEAFRISPDNKLN